MRNLAVLFVHFIAVLARLLGPGGVRSLVAESLLLKRQLLIVNRSRRQSPNLSARDRILGDWMAVVRKNSIRLPSDRDAGTYSLGFLMLGNPKNQSCEQ